MLRASVFWSDGGMGVRVGQGAMHVDVDVAVVKLWNCIDVSKVEIRFLATGLFSFLPACSFIYCDHVGARFMRGGEVPSSLHEPLLGVTCPAGYLHHPTKTSYLVSKAVPTGKNRNLLENPPDMWMRYRPLISGNREDFIRFERQGKSAGNQQWDSWQFWKLSDACWRWSNKNKTGCGTS